MGVRGLGAVVALLLLAIAPRAGAMPADPDVPESGPAYLVRNINESRDRSYGSDPYGYVAAGGFLYFFADDGERGRELWRSDLAAGTTLPWRELGFASSLATAAHAFAFGDVLFVLADDGVWRSDGTPAGTAQLLPGGGWWTHLAGSTLYLARDGALWALTDPRGTPQRLAQLDPDRAAIQNVVREGRRIFFTACGYNYGYRICDLWVADGTAAGTQRLATVPDAVSALTTYNELQVIAAESGAFVVGCGSPESGDGTPVCELWYANGAAPVAAPLVRLISLADGYAYAIRDPLALGRGLFFTGCTVESGCEAWFSDGTVAATRILVDAVPGPDSVVSDSDLNVERAAWQGVAYYLARTPASGIEVWRSDGTPTGTHLLRDINPGPGDGVAERDGFYDIGSVRFTPLGDVMTFAATDGVHGVELWRTDGTEKGTHLVADLVPGVAGVFDSFDQCANDEPSPPRVAGGTLWFLACVRVDSDDHWQLWRSDGATAEGPIETDIGWRTLVAGGRLYFTRRDRERYTTTLAWRDGAREETLPLPLSPWALDYALPIGAGVAVTGWQEATGLEPYSTDGTPEGTRLLRDIASADASAEPADLTALGGALLFSADDGVHGRELWRSDASAAGTALVADIHPGAGGSGPEQLVVLGDAVVFTADDGVHGVELWRSDGTATGTWLVADVHPGATGSLPHRFHVAGDTLYFWADDGVHGRELWRSDGTPAGTALVADLRPGPLGSDTEYGPNHSWPYPGGGATWRGMFYFAADDGVSGEDLWRSDGTPAGTHLVADLPDTERGDSLYDLQPAGDRLVFGRTGRCPCAWESDGTADGTRRLAALVWIDRVVTVGDVVYANAHDVIDGGLWRLDPQRGWELLTSDAPWWLFDFNGLLFGFTPDDGLWRQDFGYVGPNDLPRWDADWVATERSLLMFSGDTRVLWTSDGTADGTVPLQRLPEAARRREESDSAYGFTHAGDSIFFAANTGDIGNELWALPADALPAVCIDDCPWHWTPTPTDTPEPATPEPATPTPTVVPATPTPTPACGDDCTVVTLAAANGPAGSRVTLSARLSARREAIAGVDLTLALDRDLSVAVTTRGLPDCRVDPAIDKPASAFRFAPHGCTPGRDCSGVRALVIAVDNVDPIADGATLFTCTLDIAARARPGRRTLSIARLDASDANGWPTAAKAANGEMTVLARAAQTTAGGGADSGGCQTTAGEPSTPSPLAWPLIPAILLLAIARRRSRRPPPPRLCP